MDQIADLRVSSYAVDHCLVLETPLENAPIGASTTREQILAAAIPTERLYAGVVVVLVDLGTFTNVVYHN